jgi:hypothetical protein
MSESLPTPRSKVRFFPVRAVKDRLRPSEQRAVEASALAALKAANAGWEIFYLKFEHDGMSFALHSRVNPKGQTLDVEYDFISPGMSPGPITQAQHRAAVDKFRARRNGARMGGRLSGVGDAVDID